MAQAAVDDRVLAELVEMVGDRSLYSSCVVAYS